MEKLTVIKVDDKNISVRFEDHIVHVIIDNELTALLAHKTELVTDALTKSIKAKYVQLFNKQFLVSDASVTVEIWGHVYADKFAKAIQKIAPFNLLKKLMGKIAARCEVIDIGESGHDYNRFVWNAMAPFKAVIAKLLPGK